MHALRPGFAVLNRSIGIVSGSSRSTGPSGPRLTAGLKRVQARSGLWQPLVLRPGLARAIRVEKTPTRSVRGLLSKFAKDVLQAS